MIWIILGVLPILFMLGLVAADDLEMFSIIVGCLVLCALMSLSIAYGLYQMGIE